MQTMGVRPASSAACVFFATLSSVSPEDLAAFGVADDDVAASGFDEHFRRDFAGEGAFFAPGKILAGDGDVAAFCGFDGNGDSRERRRDDDVAVSLSWQRAGEMPEKKARVSPARLVHFPVAGNDAAAGHRESREQWR